MYIPFEPEALYQFFEASDTAPHSETREFADLVDKVRQVFNVDFANTKVFTIESCALQSSCRYSQINRDWCTYSLSSSKSAKSFSK